MSESDIINHAGLDSAVFLRIYKLGYFQDPNFFTYLSPFLFLDDVWRGIFLLEETMEFEIISSLVCFFFHVFVIFHACQSFNFFPLLF